MPIPEWTCGWPQAAITRLMASPISRRSRLDLVRMFSSNSSVTLARNEGFDVSCELVDFARFAGGLDLAMDALFEAFQVAGCRSVLALGVIRGFYLDRAEGDDLTIHDDPDIVTFQGTTQQFG